MDTTANRDIPGWVPLLERKAKPVNARTIRSMGHRMGRNDICPCGSKRKWKRCHGRGS